MQALRILFVCSLLFSFFTISTTNTLNTITSSQYIRDGESTLVSAGGSFELGFFTPGKLKGRYLGIWYTISTETIVWVANRETPLEDFSGVLKVTDQGVLVLLNSSNSIIWSSNSSRTAENPVSQLLDSGNLVVKDGNEPNPDNFLWQSFDYPCDTLLPEMKLGWNLVTGLERYISSWKSAEEDPAQGEFSLRLDPHGFPQIFVMNGAKIQTRAGSWNGLELTGYVRRPNPISEFEFVLSRDEVYYEYILLNRLMFSRYVLNPYGIAQWFTWNNHTRSWELFFTTQADQCEKYALCGPYASCNVSNNPQCACLKGFVPKSPKDWNSGYWSDGCVRKTPLACSNRDGFFTYSRVKFPDTSSSWYDKSLNLKECKGLCLGNCSCTAYANLDVREGGSGCLLWFGILTDIRAFTSDAQDIYVRIAASELDNIEKRSKFKKEKQAAILISSAVFLMGMLIVGLVLYIRKKKFRNQGVKRQDYLEEDREDMELPLFDLTTVANATNDFSSRNKVGEGGFGTVYKGTLIGGQEIAAKRLSKNSGQGMREFKNEVILIAKLQHRNLVNLLGCCTQEDEKILIYEFMPNRSLNFFIFDDERKKLLDWPKCFHIIDGIARGVLYLHQDSRLRIIHRDLKASNILLDNDMNPKISDFGLAKTFGSDQSHANTNRVVGTYGYMPPEYAVDGIFSTKSDVFSFGVVLLEILSRRRNRGFCHPDHHLNLLGHAWTLWNQNKPLELIDKALFDSCTKSEVLRCLHVGLLCVQRVPEDRPSMSSVVIMLSSEIMLPLPKQPGFYTERSLPESPSRMRDPCSANNFSITLLEARLKRSILCMSEASLQLGERIKIYSLRKSMQILRTLFVCSFNFSFLRTSTTNTLDNITPSQYIRDGETLVSAGGSFELGFFSPGQSKGRYLGIYMVHSVNETVVWVANRETPLIDSSGVLKVTNQGVLVLLLNSSNSIVWSSNSTRTAVNPVSQLLDSGNLVVKDGTNLYNFLWQSFDYPCDTYLPEMKIGWNFVTGLDRYTSSWKSTEDPAPGDFSLRMNPRGLPQIVVMKGGKIQARGGSLNGLRLTGYPRQPNPIPEYEFLLNKDEVYYEYRLLNRSLLSIYTLNPLGIAQRFTWVDQTHSWELSSTFQADQCENYALCGAFTSCNINNSPLCACLKGFVPKSPKDWNSGYWSDGCVRKTPLACSYGDGFLKQTRVKLPDTSSSQFDKSLSLKECKGLCLENCSCTAYANLDIREGGSGCLLWFGNLTDIREFAPSSGQDIYIRMAASELDQIKKKSKFNKKKQVGILISSAVFLVGMLIVGLILYKRKKKLGNQEVRRKDYFGEDREDMELPLFDLTKIANATNDFSSSNKLGEGGFGPVYKGTLIGGKEFAVKRLSKNSGQGMIEYKNEVILIAKLQHRNLVKLLGCCFQEDEKMLIYEFMPNGSLDYFIFDQERKKLLDWPKCFHIIDGIARGLLYLHQDSRLRIIHRDLKASNILLDHIIIPKISDFGLAKIFSGDQSQANTNRVVGTYGYMSPEYAVDGIYSTKSDVFSFGVILLEILSRKKNRGFCHPDHHLNLLGHAWILWIQNKPLELIDETLSDSCTISEVLRCLHVGLLCVQRVPEDRPTMSSVVLMLSSEITLPPPKEPGFYTERSLLESPSRMHDSCSENNFTITLLARYFIDHSGAC